MSDKGADEEAPIAAAAVPVAEPAELAMKDQQRKGAKCCGCCCDMRRAVIALAILGMVLSIIYLILTATATGLGFGFARVVDDKDDRDNLNDLGTLSAVAAVGFAVIFFFYVFELVAALRYNACMLCVVVFLQLVSMGYYIWVSWEATEVQIEQGYQTSANHVGDVLIPVIVHGIFIYPVVGLIMQIKSGVMSAETYPREAYSCCCKPRV